MTTHSPQLTVNPSICRQTKMTKTKREGGEVVIIAVLAKAGCGALLHCYSIEGIQIKGNLTKFYKKHQQKNLPTEKYERILLN
jgi:hypothetical protein